MTAIKTFQDDLKAFLEKFTASAEKFDGTIRHCSELEQLINEYTSFITSKHKKKIWKQLELQTSSEWRQLAADLRRESAQCVAMMEKYRALKLLYGKEELTDYFQNIESCIEREFQRFPITSDAKVLLVGSGAFPMTPLLIARRTMAEVVGIDIDDEAIQLGRNVIEKLGNGLHIRLVNQSLEKLPFIKHATHVIFSSTVEAKYDMLHQLHALTKTNVVVAVRYGDQLKSLFNYPMREVDAQKWKLAEKIVQPNHIFDIALYKKA
ncbi:Methyltransferase domain-containing protein [Evansella caseinilytica]|uniref:Methyltransferase domain-containing protein n=1 Tax=Evansella caseinilytica TaxID=1503961 RepID=A0A1H3SMU5_9BACI|nr:class I SAM-dependent methyltransferase [Evansella caseinilytica]SDZ38881.1 Methyltransferase domain-containing protein [Evansella caseinilytica]